MLPRALEVLLVALLVVLTVAAVFSFMNHQHQLENQRLLRQMVGELKTQRESTQALSQVIAALQAKAALSAAPPHAPSPPDPIVEVRSPIAAAALPAPPVPRPAVPETKVPKAPEPAASETAKDPVVAPPAASPKPGPPEVAVAVVPPPALPTPVPAAAKTPKPAPPTVAPATPITPKAPSVPVAAPDSPTSAGSKAYEGNWKRDEPVVRQVIEQLLGGRYQSVVRRFDRTLASELPQADLAAVIDPIRFKHLGMKQILGHQAVPHTLGANTNVYEVAAEMSDGHRLVFTITLDQKQRITGLIMK
ncbi:MAG: hypothetical protein OER86_08785 [Phycisphaerae bacterium]|nr:hypothetical protein [Phycisphaerae bacterium]